MALALSLWVAYFFRDPERSGDRGHHLVVAPADGKVVLISEVEEPAFISGPATRVSIFMNVFSVHVNRYPVSGVVRYVNYARGKFRNAVTPEWRAQFDLALDYSWRRFQIMVGEEYGIRWLPTYTEARRPETPLIPTFPPINRMLGPTEHPFPVDSIARYGTLYVETGRFLRQMLRDIQLAGGRIGIRSFRTPADIAALPERLAFNCTGLGARELMSDQELRPARGQLAILLPQPEVQYAFTGQAGYMFPRADGIILGGTFELDQWSTEPEPAAIARILESHRQLFAGLRCTPSA